MINFLVPHLKNNGYDFSEEKIAQFAAYLELMQRWNRVFNLTGIRDPEKMVLLHILDSLSIHSYLVGNKILDVGSGAGLPGIPLALMYPDKKFVLLDSNQKKVRFLKQAKAELNLSNVEVIESRCEKFYPSDCFTSIVSRAFASIEVMLDATSHLICPEGQFLAMKGIYPESEIADLPKGFKLLNVYPIKIEGLDAARCLVCIGSIGKES